MSPGIASLAVADHGGGIDDARARFGGGRGDWIDLSTGVNPVAYPMPTVPSEAWTALPDHGAQTALAEAARRFWQVPDGAAVLAAPGTSAVIARLPGVCAPGQVRIPDPTYGEHRRAFEAQGWIVTEGVADALVLVHPNNPDGRLWSAAEAEAGLVVLDESFADIAPEASLITLGARPGVVVLKGLGKFWGLAGLRLGFAIGDPRLLTRLETLLGPWPVSGPALAIGTAALSDPEWADATRRRLSRDAVRLDALLAGAGARVIGGTVLFRLVEVTGAVEWQEELARHHIWTRIFPYSATWLRIGLPGTESAWARLAAALKDMS